MAFLGSDIALRTEQFRITFIIADVGGPFSSPGNDAFSKILEEANWKPIINVALLHQFLEFLCSASPVLRSHGVL